jgi:hypothetical protein
LQFCIHGKTSRNEDCTTNLLSQKQRAFQLSAFQRVVYQSNKTAHKTASLDTRVNHMEIVTSVQPRDDVQLELIFNTGDVAVFDKRPLP